MTRPCQHHQSRHRCRCRPSLSPPPCCSPSPSTTGVLKLHELAIMPRVLRCNMRGTCAQTAIVVAVLLAQCQQTGCSNDARRRAPAVPVSVQDRIKRKTRQWQPGTREGGVGVGGEGADEQPVAQRPATDQDGDGSWRNKAAERLGLARGAGQERSSETKAGTAEAANNALQCNVTLACHACPEASIRDRAEYCLPTRWRQQVRCLRLGVEVEVRFESCKNCTTLRCVANRVCAACSRCSLRSYACMPVSHGVHVGLPLIDPNRRLSPSGCFLTHTYTHTNRPPHTHKQQTHGLHGAQARARAAQWYQSTQLCCRWRPSGRSCSWRAGCGCNKGAGVVRQGVREQAPAQTRRARTLPWVLYPLRHSPLRTTSL
jgi:hypothetical protein